jgi:hypothetical protein
MVSIARFIEMSHHIEYNFSLIWLVCLLQLFSHICPDEEFLPKNSAPVYADDDSDSAE